MRILLIELISTCKRFIVNAKLRFLGYNIHRTALIESNVVLDKVYPSSLIIGEFTLVARGSVILTHDHHKREVNGDPKRYRTVIGSNCFIGINAIILPGVKVGNHVIIGAGAIVKDDIPDNSIAAGSPARVVKQGIMTRPYGIVIDQL